MCEIIDQGLSHLDILQRRELRERRYCASCDQRSFDIPHTPSGISSVVTTMFKLLMQSSRSQPPTIRQDLCEVSHPERFRRPPREEYPKSPTDLRKTPEIHREGWNCPPILWPNLRKSPTAHMQTAWLQGKREVCVQRVLFASTREVTCLSARASSRGHVRLM